MRRVAVLAAIAAVVGGAVLMLFRSRGLSPGYFSLHSFTDDASGLMDGTQVRLNGIPIGYLDAQNLTKSRDLMRKVRLDLKVRDAYLEQIPADSVVGLASDNLLGDLYIAIHRGQSSAHVQPGAELPAIQAQDISKIMARLGQQMDRLQSISDRIDRLLSEATAGHGSVGKLVNNPTLKQATGVSAQLQALMDDVRHGKGTMTKLFFDDPLSAQMQSPMKRLDDIMGTADHRSTQMKELTTELNSATKEFQALQAEAKSGKGSLAKLDALQQNVDALTVKWDAMVARVTAGQGTIGQLLVNPQMNQALDAAMRDVQALVQGLKTNPKKVVSLKIF
jgi:phospholipid/cholesterol/gamma-HCH transport system substrate-binding protein